MRKNWNADSAVDPIKSSRISCAKNVTSDSRGQWEQTFTSKAASYAFTLKNTTMTRVMFHRAVTRQAFGVIPKRIITDKKKTATVGSEGLYSSRHYPILYK